MAQHGWLSRRPAAFREAVITRCRMRRYGEGEAVYREGDPSNSMMGLVQGRWFVRVPPADIAITIGQPGFWIGEAGIFRGVERAASVISATPSVGLFLPPTAFEELAANPEYCRHFAANTAEALAQAIAVIGNLSQPRSDVRVAQRLVTLAVFSNSRSDNVIPISQADLAELCNLSRSSMAKVLQDLASLKLITLEYRKIVISDLTALSDYAWSSDRIWR